MVGDGTKDTIATVKMKSGKKQYNHHHLVQDALLQFGGSSFGAVPVQGSTKTDGCYKLQVLCVH